MRIFAIDGEGESLRRLHGAIAQAAPGAEILDFTRGEEALSAMETQGIQPDAVFAEVRLPGLDGLALCARLKEVSPAAKVVFVTSGPEYALQAMYLHASGYILKPLQESRVREELEHAVPRCTGERLRIQCFGRFEVYWQGKPLLFGRRQTRELLAFLVDRAGGACTAEEIAQALWEGETDMHALKHRLRALICDLKKTLSAIGMEEVLVRRSGLAAIRRDLVDCDYFRMLDGDGQGEGAFRGEYMKQYSWPERTAGRLYFKNRK